MNIYDYELYLSDPEVVIDATEIIFDDDYTISKETYEYILKNPENYVLIECDNSLLYPIDRSEGVVNSTYNNLQPKEFTLAKFFGTHKIIATKRYKNASIFILKKIETYIEILSKTYFSLSVLDFFIVNLMKKYVDIHKNSPPSVLNF